jgi:hypothetical protein
MNLNTIFDYRDGMLPDNNGLVSISITHQAITIVRGGENMRRFQAKTFSDISTGIACQELGRRREYWKRFAEPSHQKGLCGCE